MLKNKYILGVAFAAMLGFGSCVDLDMEPQGSPEAGEVADERMAFLRLAAVYSDVKSFFYTWSMQCFGDVLSEDATYSGSANDASTFQLMENFQYPADHNEILNKYKQSYQCINKANLFIRDMEQTSDEIFSKYNKEQMIGEAKFIRAYTYFELVKIFGEVPCYTDVLELDHERLGRASLETIYATIEKDLNEAAAVLPLKSEVPDYLAQYAGRITKGAAYAMQTRVYLYEEKYEEVKRVFKENILPLIPGEYDLENDYKYMFSLEGEHCQESILEVCMYTSTNLSGYTTNNGNRHVLMSMPRNMTNGFGCAQPTQALADAYDAVGDTKRKNVTLLSRQEAIDIELAAHPGAVYGDREVPEITDDRTGWYNRKMYLAPGQREENYGNNQPTNLRLIRLAEVYLNYAEACSKTNDEANAIKYLNLIRERADLAGYPNLTGDANLSVFEAIMQERHLEFGMEGFRFFDVVRVGWGEKVFYPGFKSQFGRDEGFKKGAEKLPIPQIEIDISNGGITN